MYSLVLTTCVACFPPPRVLYNSWQQVNVIVMISVLYRFLMYILTFQSRKRFYRIFLRKPIRTLHKRL